MDEPRSVPIRQSLLRPELVMGGEREPVMCSALFAILTGTSGAASGQFMTIGLALAFYGLLLRRGDFVPKAGQGRPGDDESLAPAYSLPPFLCRRQPVLEPEKLEEMKQRTKTC